MGGLLLQAEADITYFIRTGFDHCGYQGTKVRSG